MSNFKAQFHTLRETKYIAAFLNILNSPYFPVIYAFFILLSSLFGWELTVYVSTALLIVFICLFDEDTKPIIALAALVVYSTSWTHTPQPPYNSKFFYSPATLSVIIVCTAIAVVAMGYRFFSIHSRIGCSDQKSILKSGLLLLAVSLILNGCFHSSAPFKDLLLGITVAFSFVALYLFLSKTLNFNKQFGMYFANVLFICSVVIVIQVMKLLIFGHILPSGKLSVFLPDGSISKDRMVTGWGMSNNIGGMLAMFLPVNLYLAYKSRFGKYFYLWTILQLITIAFTLSRSSLLVGGVIAFCGGILLSVIQNKNRKFIRITNIISVVVCIIGCFIFYDQIKELFFVIFDRGFSDSNRFEIWKNGLDNFLSAPIFGVGFYAPFHVDVNIENWLFPDMYHNIVIQIAASCGLFGLIAYVLHISQISILLFRRPNAENIFYFAIFAAISGASLLDNHIFHIFPALIYSMSMALWENNIKRKSLRSYCLMRTSKRFVKI